MNVPTITMPVEDAKVAFREYRKAVGANPNHADQAIMMGYRALAQGRAVLNLADALRAGGLDAKGLPKLAIGRASWKWVQIDRDYRSDLYRFAKWPSVRYGRNAHVAIPREAGLSIGRYYNARAMVPMIPPSLRPAEASLNDYHILWEAVWEVQPPTDPVLLRHLTGNLYAVLAAWDLTPIERAVLGAVRTAEANR